MGQVIDFILKNWIIITLVVAIFLAIVGYIVESKNLNKNKKQIKREKKEDIKYVQMQTYNKSLNEDEIVFENVNKAELKENNNQIMNKMYDDYEQQEIKDSIQEIIDNKDLALNERDQEILENDPLKEMKEQFDELEFKIDPIKDPKIEEHINTDIKLPDIEISNDNDIWS